MQKRRLLIYFADLTHTGPVISSNVMPLGIGLIGAYLLKTFRDEIELELFKFPDDLSSALEQRTPDIMGFANYSWNLELSYEYAGRVKNLCPETTVVFGGPNYGLTHEELIDFWHRYPLIDAYIVKEGEQAMVEFIRNLLACDLDMSTFKNSEILSPNCHYFFQETLVMGEELPRVEVNELPSPYLMGLMDKFFDSRLCPLIYTTRGCPFKCTFCAEGEKYYNKVKHQNDLENELEYIAQRVNGVSELLLTDANFGMFKQDIEKAHIIARMQDKYGYPEIVIASTGKNRKEQVLEVASIINGAMHIAAALQSTDPDVLSNVKRDNISLDSLSQIAKGAIGAKTDTYTELILGLPGDSVGTHSKSVRDAIEADFGIVRNYQLIMLPQTELNTPENRQKFEMKTKHRIMPRSLGMYKLAGEEFVAVETEEICVETNTLTFEDYVQCRELDLTVEVLHNGRTFRELQGLCEWVNQPWFDFIIRVHEKRRSHNEALTQLYDSFVEGTVIRLGDTREQVKEYVAENLHELLNDEKSTNEMASAKSTAFFRLQDVVHDLMFDSLIQDS